MNQIVSINRKPKIQTPKVDFDPELVIFNYWTAILHFENKLTTEIQKRGKVFYLDDMSQQQTELSAPEKTTIIWKNDNDSAVLNFSIFSKETSLEIFCLKLFPSKNSIKLEFKKSGDYFFKYREQNTQTVTKGKLEIISSVNSQNHQTKNLSSDLKSTWY